MKLYVYTVLSTVSLSMVFLLGYVCFIMFGGVVPSEGAYERFSLYKREYVIQHDVLYDVRLQPAENVQHGVPSFYYRGGASGAVDVPYSYIMQQKVELVVQ